MTEQEWLDADNHKIILVDLSYHDGTSLNTKYFSNYPYVLKYGDSFTNIIGDVTSGIAYDDILFDIPKLTTRINSTKVVGNITLLNTDGTYDDMLEITNSWEGHSIKIYIGDPSWSRNQFILILEGVINSLTAPQQHILSIDIRDKKEVLNVVAQETTIWNNTATDNYLNETISSTGLYNKFPALFAKKLYDKTGTYIDFDTSLGSIPSGTENSLVPICLGKVFNIEPVLVDTYNHVYQIHECPDITNYGIAEVTEVRSNGVKLTGVNDTYVDTLVAGTGGTLDLTGVIVTDITNNNITVTGADFTTNGFSRAVIENSTLGEARYVIGSPSATVAVTNTNATNQDAATAGWTTAHSYNVWYPTNAPTVYELQYEENLTAGCIRLLVHDRSTQITCDVIGQQSRTQYTEATVIPGVVLHSAAALLEYLILEKTSLEVTLTGTDLCPKTFSPTGELPFTNTNSLGIYIKDESTVLNLVTQIMASVGGYIRFERICILQIFRFIDPELETSKLTLTEDSTIQGGFTLKGIELPEKSVNLGYMRNWTVQDKAAIASSVLDNDDLELLDQITTEYSNIISYTGQTTTEYPLLTDSDLVGTLIHAKADAITEADRRAVIRSKKRYIFKIDAVSSPFSLNIGDVITIIHSRYNFVFPGKNVVIIGLEEFPTDKRAILEVWG